MQSKYFLELDQLKFENLKLSQKPVQSFKQTQTENMK